MLKCFNTMIKYILNMTSVFFQVMMVYIILYTSLILIRYITFLQYSTVIGVSCISIIIGPRSGGEYFAVG